MPLTLSRGVILSVGGQCNGERWEIVFPIATDDVTIPDSSLCSNAVADFGTGAGNPGDKFLACCSDDLEILFVQAIGLQAGKIPSRQDAPAGTLKGTRGPNSAPLNVAAILSFYADPAQIGVGNRMRVAKTFIPGIQRQDLVGNTISDGLKAKVVAFATVMGNGWAVAANPGKKWFRILNTKDAGGGNCYTIKQAIARDYFGTVRRRLLPR